jgi:phosphoserine phosphatase RsbU/P
MRQSAQRAGWQSAQPTSNVPGSRANYSKLEQFWRRVSDGMKLNELWTQLHTDARSTYRLYSREIDAAGSAEATGRRRIIPFAKKFFWAILEKLTPARRVVLLIALGLLLMPEVMTFGNNKGEQWAFRFESHLTGGLLMFGLLVLELTDRVIMKRDLQIAKEIQSWLLPAAPPQVPGLQIAFATQPANTVAGDYYDVFPRRCGETAPSNGTSESYLIAVADVAGKSIPAAMLMSTIQASLRTLCTTPGPITELVARMNRYVCTTSQQGRRFTTAFIGEYDPASRVLAYVNAGHNAPLLRRRSGSFEALNAGGLPLGVMETAVYEKGSVVLEPGDLLTAFTDGVVEAENAATEEYGEMRLRRMLQVNAAAPPDAILRSLLFDIQVFVGNAPQHDDVTLMLLKAV